jgi:hypothetical protein
MERPMTNAWNVTENEYRKARQMFRDSTSDSDQEALCQLIRYYRGEIFYRDEAERGCRLVREALMESPR